MHMTDMTKTVRGVDVEAYRVFRSKAVEMGLTTGEAITQALRLWVNAQNRPRVIVRAEMEAAAPTSAPAATPLPMSPPEHPA